MKYTEEYGNIKNDEIVAKKIKMLAKTQQRLKTLEKSLVQSEIKAIKKQIPKKIKCELNFNYTENYEELRIDDNSKACFGDKTEIDDETTFDETMNKLKDICKKDDIIMTSHFFVDEGINSPERTPREVKIITIENKDPFHIKIKKFSV